jgi:hypothetical protein
MRSEKAACGVARLRTKAYSASMPRRGGLRKAPHPMMEDAAEHSPDWKIEHVPEVTRSAG